MELPELQESGLGFAAGTLIRTKEGHKPIDEICVGDLVLSFPDDETPPPHSRMDHEYLYQRVISVSRLDNQSAFSLKILCTVSGLLEIVKAGQRQPIFKKGTGWACASNLKFCALENSAFGNSMLTKVRPSDESTHLYSLELESMHTYYVGQIGIWVHAL
jgi:hypothetical protein